MGLPPFVSSGLSGYTTTPPLNSNMLEQEKVLTHAKLRLDKDIVEGAEEDGHRILKSKNGSSHLIVSDDQYRILQRFRAETTLSTLVPQLIMDRRCPPLRELYELVLQALDARILNCEDYVPQSDLPTPWPFGIRRETSLMMGGIFILIGLFSLFRNHPQLPRPITEFGWLDILVGYAAICVSLTLGQFFSGSVLKGADRDVFRPRFVWGTIFPHFQVDQRDAIMGGRPIQAAVALARLSPLFIIAGIISFAWESAEYVCMLGIFYLTDPFGNSPLNDLLTALYARHRKTTDEPEGYLEHPATATKWSSQWKALDKRYVGVRTGHLFLWSFIVIFLSCWAWGVSIPEVYKAVVGSTHFLVVCICALVFGILAAIAICMELLRKRLEDMQAVDNVPVPAASRKATEETLSREGIIEFLSKTLLFGDCNRDTLDRIVDAIEAESIRPQNKVVEEGEPGGRLYIVYAGTVDLFTTQSDGTARLQDSLKDGDVFGDVALLRQSTQPYTARTTAQCVLLTLSKADFEAFVIPAVGSRKILEITQKRTFLARIGLCRHWNTETIAQFATLCVVNNVAKGEYIIRAKRDNMFFYIVFEGTFNVTNKAQVLATLRKGDFFGEISLLQNSATTADVIAAEDGKVLTVHKSDFIRFLGLRHTIALQIEGIAGKRLGRPVFPLQSGSFDTVSAK